MAVAESAILLKDALGEKNQGRIAGLWKSSAKAVYRGDLLLTLPRVMVVPRKDGKKAHNYQLASDPSITLYCTEDDVAPMSDYEYHLMAAVKSREVRYEIFQKDILDWGSKLKEGTFVYVTLPSKSPVSNQRAVSVIRYIGPLPNEHGIQFAVEIQEEQYRHQGSSNGLFGGEQYFECEDYCALFVSLDRLTPMAPVQQGPQPELPPFTDPQRLHQMKTRSQNKTLQSDLDQHGRRDHSPKQPRPHYKIHDRVVVHNKRGVGIHGTVKWIEEVNFAGDKLIGVGIETDIAVQSKDFDGALHGLSQLFKCTDSSHGKIVMPEPMVVSERFDAIQRDKQKEQYPTAQGTSVDVHAQEHEHVHTQFRDVTQQREDEYLKGALQTGRIDREQQIRLMREIENTHKGKKQNAPGNQPYIDPYHPQSHYEAIPGSTDSSNRPSYQHPSSRPPDLNEQRTQPSAGASSAKARVHTYDSPNAIRRELQKMRDQHSIQDDHLLGHRPEGGGGSTVPLRHQKSMPVPASADEQQFLYQPPNNAHQVQQNDPSNHPLYHNIPGSGGILPQQFQPHEEWHPDNKPMLEQLNERHHSDNLAYYQHNQPVHQGGGAEIAQDFQTPHDQSQYMHQHQLQGAYQEAIQGAQQLQQGVPEQYGTTTTQPPYDRTHPSNTHLPGAVVPQKAISHSFSVGSTVQLPSSPPRYGIIQWIGTLPGILEGRIAGVELEDPMEGCSDGTWNGLRYFSCRQGHGFFCPISSLAPDQRFAQAVVTDVNPLDGVAVEEPHDQFINPGQIFRYIGEGKGIQGHQNSCYIDSTVFGLFAVSDVFDDMFLEQKAHDPAGDQVKYLLWKGIVNPLRKNGVVRHESVMKLQNKLEELGKMKGVNQDEKDPEGFLNMLFKHTLHVPPFINIKRPFGVEQEYFVQLFVEHDELLKLPTVGDLLSRMFKEQKIRITKVPSKLLIQIPRYVRVFKPYRKTIPSIKLELKGLLTSKRQCCICADSAWKECHECTSDFTKPVQFAPEVVYFCEKCAQFTHAKGTKRDHHDIQEVAPDTGKINELDLLSVVCIETSHYICFTRSDDRWVFFDSMANRVNDMYYIPQVVDCTNTLNEWVYPANGDLTRLLNTPPRELPEYVRRFTQDIYLCVYIQPDVGMYGDFELEEEEILMVATHEIIQKEEHTELSKEHVQQMSRQIKELEANYNALQEEQKKSESQIVQLREDLEREQCQRMESDDQRVHLQKDLQKEKESSAKLQQQLSEIKSENRSLQNSQLESVAFGIEPWKVSRNKVELGSVIGGGGWGVVSKGKLQVAVKQFYPNILSKQNISRLKREMQMLALIRHPNLLQFIAAVFDENEDHEQNPPYIITELLDMSLRVAYEKALLPNDSVLSVFQDVARALDYLHRRHEPIIHRDVSSANVLLKLQEKGKVIAKLSDLGSANLAKEAYTMNEGARVYCAPEAFTPETDARSAANLTPKVDVYSYGIVLCEVATSKFPDGAQLPSMLTRVRYEWPQLHQLIIACTNRNPEQRPTMANVLGSLKAFPPQN